MASMKAGKTVSTQSSGHVKKEPAAAAKLGDNAAAKTPAPKSGAKKAAPKAPQEPKKKIMEKEASNLDNTLPLKTSTQKRKLASLKPQKPAGAPSSPAPGNIKEPTSKTCQSCTPGATTGTPTATPTPTPTPAPAPRAAPTSKPTSNKAELGIKGAGAKLAAD